MAAINAAYAAQSRAELQALAAERPTDFGRRAYLQLAQLHLAQGNDTGAAAAADAVIAGADDDDDAGDDDAGGEGDDDSGGCRSLPEAGVSPWALAFVLPYTAEQSRLRALEALDALLSPGGMMIHHCPNYTVPFEPHFGIPLVPGAPERTAALLPDRIRSTARSC